MSYVVPPRFSQGNYPTAANINKYKDGVDAIHAALGDYRVNVAVSERIGHVQAFYFVHRQRWLVYKGAGRIEDVTSGGETTTISAADDGGFTSYDLDQIEWMTPGHLYRVQDVVSCWEDFEGYP